jgi:carbon storage regulator
MLVLSRKEKERLIIGGNIVVTIVRLSHGSVRLGIEAPPEIQIKREELLGHNSERHDKTLTRVA